MGKYVIFGAGKWGKKAIEEYGEENILYIIDNNVEKLESMQGNLKVVNLDYYVKDTRKPTIIVAIKNFPSIVNQLKEYNITDYILYYPKFTSYFDPDVLIYNPYDYRKECKTESEYNAETNNSMWFRWVDDRVKLLSDKLPIFQHIEIETYNRCNGVCDFCPVSIRNESRPEHLMDTSLFEKIIAELEELNYDGRIALFSNNEPFLDTRILQLHKYTRGKLPNARMHLYTNGTLLTLNKFIELMEYLDELIIDNYNQDLKLIPNCRDIRDYCEDHPELIKKVTIVLRKPHEILATRGGDAPNRHEKICYEDTKCTNPFTQMIIRPDGKVSLCCNDPLGKNTMGDLTKNSLKEIWYGDEFSKVRSALMKGRQYLPHCKYCDVFSVD